MFNIAKVRCLAIILATIVGWTRYGQYLASNIATIRVGLTWYFDNFFSQKQ